MTEKRVSRPDAQKKAEIKYNQKRLKKPSIPAIRLEPEEHQLAEDVFAKYGKTKKEAVLEGLRLLKESINGK